MTKILGLFVFKYIDTYIDWEIQSMIISYLRSTQLEYIITKYPDLNWDYEQLAKRITPYQIIKYAKESYVENGKVLYPNAIFRAAIDHRYKKLTLSKNLNLTIECIALFPDYMWDWDYISNTLKDYIEQYPNKPWTKSSRHDIVYSHNFTYEMLDPTISTKQKLAICSTI